MSEHINPHLLFVGDDLALDFINTEYGVGSEHRECFENDHAVLAWLKQAEILADDIALPPEGLHKLALQLRENAKCLVNAAKNGQSADATVVNRVLQAGLSSTEVKWDNKSMAFTVVKRHRKDDAAAFLEPVAQAIVALLTTTPLNLVRQCEAHGCTLMFHDKTKSHRRRWCSMALCGNRMKVAAFRSRKKVDGT